MEMKSAQNGAETFTFLNESQLEQLGADQNTILSTKEMGLNQGLTMTRTKAMAQRNKSCGADRSEVSRIKMADQFRLDAPSRFNYTAEIEVGSTRSQQDDSLFITTLRKKSKTSLRVCASPKDELVTTAKKDFLPRFQNYKSGTFIEQPKANMILPLPPKVKLRPIPTTRLFGDLSNCKLVTDTQDSMVERVRTRNSADPAFLPRTSRTSRNLNNNHFNFAEITDEIKDTTESRQKRRRVGETSEVRFTVEGSHCSPAPKERTTLNSFMSEQKAQQLNQMILTTIQDEQKAFESARKNHRVTDSAEFDSEQGNEVQGRENQDRKNWQIQGKHCQSEDASDDDTVQERFSQEDNSSEGYCDLTIECPKASCVTIRHKIAQKDCVILSLQEQLELLELKSKEQQTQIMDLRGQLEAEEKRKQQKAIIFETENSRLQFQADASSLLLVDNNLDDDTVQQSAKTLLRKIKSHIGGGAENLNKSNTIPESQRQLYDKLQEMLEQCLIVDNFTKDVDRSLLSYEQTLSQLPEQSQHQDDFFYLSMAAEHCRTDKHQSAAEASQQVSVSGHKRTETLPRGASIVEQQSELTSYAYNTVTFGKTSSNVKKFVSLVDGGSSSEATARNLRYHQIDESSQDISISRGHGGLDLSSRSLIKTKSQIVEENEGKNEVDVCIDEGSESDSLLFSQLTQQ